MTRSSLRPEPAAWYAGVALLAALLIGGVAGFALGRNAAGPRGQAFKQPDAAVLTLGVSRRWLLDSLGLEPDERRRVDSMLDATARTVESAADSLMRQVQVVTEELRQEIRAGLEPDTRRRFDSLLSSAPPLRMRTPVPPSNRP